MSKITVIGLVGQSVFMQVDEFHRGGETIEAKRLFTEIGGKGFNQSVASSRWDGDVTFISAVGKDGYKKEIENLLIKEDIKPVLIEKDNQTAYACIITDNNGINHVTEYLGAKLTKEDIQKYSYEIAKADILLIANEVDTEVNIEAVKIAKENNVRIIYNPAPQRDIPTFIKENVYLFTPNEFETKGLEDNDNVLVTLGEKGCYIKSLDKTIPAIKVKPVDSTGAGDTFNGVLAVMLGEGKGLEEAVQCATKASGMSVTKKGVLNSIPKR